MSVYKEKPGCVTLNLSTLKFDEVPTEGSPNLVESGAVAQAIGNLGKPLQWKGPATVAQLNAGITGIQEGWTYTLTDAGTLTDGSVAVDVGDEVAWTEDGEWFKVGGDTAPIAVFKFSGTDYPLIADMNAELLKGKDIVLIRTSYPSRYDVFYLTYRNSGSGHVRMKFTGTNEILEVEDDVWTVTEQALNGVNNGGVLTDAASVNVPNNALSTLATAQAALTLNVNVGSGEVANFAVELLPAVDCTLTVTRTVNNVATTLTPSVAGGNELTGGKMYQLTCVGSCWTLAEFGEAIAAKTLRFMFSNSGYDPTVAGVGTSGTWTKLATTQANVWDWTTSGTTFANVFEGAFSDSDNLVSVIAAGDTSTITSTRSMFDSCASLTSVCLFDTSAVTSTRSMFFKCTSLTSVPLFDTSAVTSMYYMFDFCTSLTSIPLFDTSSVTDIKGMFYSCTSLTSIPLFDTSAVTDISNMFYNCAKVEGGALALYRQASTQEIPPTITSNCFKYCGKDTTTGAAELAQIPTSWGGTGV